MAKKILVVKGKKYCSCCKLDRPVEEFTKDAHTASGLRSNCTSCRKRTRKDYAPPLTNTPGLVGILRIKCAHITCGKEFNTKDRRKVFCCPNCCKRDWYRRNKC